MSEIEDWSQLALCGAARGLAEVQPVNLNFFRGAGRIARPRGTGIP